MAELTPILTEPRTRQQFLSQLLAITGDTRLLWLPASTDTTTSTDQSLNARTATYDATIAAQLAPLGLGHSVSFDGSTDYATVPDADGLSFGNGTADSAFSVIAVVNVTNTAAARAILTKRGSGATVREWEFIVSGGDALQLFLWDDSVGVSPVRASDAAITQGSWIMVGATYSAATGGATAANDIVLYQDGLAVASTATNQATYVAMENLGGVVGLGTRASVAAIPFQGSMAMVAIVAKALSASEMWASYQLNKWFFGI